MKTLKIGQIHKNIFFQVSLDSKQWMFWIQIEVLPKKNYKSVNELVKLGMYENEALEYQNNVVSYAYVPKELWPNKNNPEE